MADKCPTCLRLFEKTLDYPLILVRNVEIHPVSEVIDYFSEEALRARIHRGRALDDQSSVTDLSLQGINRTPEIAAVYESEPVQKYFKQAYPLPGTKLYLGLSEDASHGVERTYQVEYCCEGPNLGSAGGPTLQHLAALASIYYEGRIGTKEAR